MTTIRRAAVAGTFYPADRDRLQKTVVDFLAKAEAVAPAPKAIIVPHAGYIYSGPVAASAYACLVHVGASIRRVVLLGPAHWVQVDGLATSSATAFATPLGTAPVDQEALTAVLPLPQVQTSDEAHVQEHGLEVHLPFLQTICPNFTIVPLLVGQATTAAVAEVLEKLWGSPETLIVVSSDLSHYYDYETARRLDQATSQAIERLQPEAIGPEAACGRIPIQGLLQVARRRDLSARTVDLCNSGDTAGPRDQVVGYGAFVFTGHRQ